MRNGVPLVLPMNYVAVGNALYFRTGPGSKLAAAANQDDVAFEIDEVDEVWCVFDVEAPQQHPGAYS